MWRGRVYKQCSPVFFDEIEIGEELHSHVISKDFREAGKVCKGFQAALEILLHEFPIEVWAFLVLQQKERRSSK